MNINDEHKHIFIHVPRTAGRSMKRASFVGGSGHNPMWWYKEKYLDVCDFYDDYFTWGFVRNPFDRLVSVHKCIWQYPAGKLH